MRLSNKLHGQGYVKKRLKSSLRKFYGRYGDLIKQYRSPSSEYTTFWMKTIYSDTLHRKDITPIFYRYWLGPLIPNLTYYLIGEVSIEHFQRVGHANRGRWPLRTPGPVPLWDLHVFWCRDQFLLNLSCFRTLVFRTSYGTFLLPYILRDFKNAYTNFFFLNL